ncbi:MAG: two component, sigma54 specific, Fis family transcriptional regulator [uncultured bacterium]|nr:MAG: two component, sigma54 specific, Fis family transcriptional regulator [uncultured bacterium]
MSVNRKTILIVDDEYGARESLKIILETEYNIILAENCNKALPIILNDKCDLVLLDICLPEISGLELLKDIRDRGKKLPVIMVTATKTVKTAVEAMKQGAFDYITKPFDVEEICAIVADSFKTNKTVSKNDTVFSKENIIGFKTSLKSVFKMVERLAPTDSTVLILGESGTGKELIAQAIHNTSTRMNKNFIPVHLSATSENLLESELFGHVKGAFTGADKDRIGAFELADGGSVFLDEIGEISEAVQVKLLRVIQEKEFKPVGGNTQKKINTRIIAATNKDLYKMVTEGKFRADLYYRLNVVPITLPSLKERITDIEDLCNFLVKKICNRINNSIVKIEKDVIYAFKSYNWPGNIRELENTLENMILLCDKDILTADELPSQFKSKSNFDNCISQDDASNVLSSVEKEAIQIALKRNNGVLTSTAKSLGTTRRILKYKMDKLGIDKTEMFRN